MPKLGDRVIVEGAKIGSPRREGTLVGVTGSILKVRWSDETESLFTPGAGTVTFAPAGDGPTARGSAGGKPAAKHAGASVRSGMGGRGSAGKAVPAKKPATTKKPAKKR